MNWRFRIFAVLVIVFVCGLQAGAVAAPSPAPAPVIPHPFFYLTPDTVSSDPTFSDEQFDSLSTSVIFKVNSTQIRPDDKFYRIYKEEILPAVNTRHLQLRKIYIRGAASPEGPYANNQRLARGRSEALLAELKRGLEHQYLDAEIDVNSVTEDYGYLCVLMKNANDEDYIIVKGIYEGCGHDEVLCKKRLMEFDGGRLWSRLLKQYFPHLRAARVIIWFSEPDAAHAPMEELANLEPQTVIPDVGKVSQLESLDVLTADQISQLRERRHLIAVRTNLLHDFFYMPGFGMAFSPNVQFEYYPKRGHLTYNIGMTWGTNRKWDTQQFWQVRDFQMELRRYFKGGGQFRGLYLGAFLHGDVYGIGLGPDEGWEGEGGEVGLSLGYTMRLNKKGSLRLEFMAAAGYFLTVFDPYVYGNPITGNIDGYYYYNYLGNASNFKKRNHLFTWFGPTNLGIQLTYDIIYRKRTHRIPWQP